MWYFNYMSRKDWETPFEKKIQYKDYNPVPFCIPHVNQLKGNNLLHKKFDKWVNLPKSAHKLYWKFHKKFWES